MLALGFGDEGLSNTKNNLVLLPFQHSNPDTRLIIGFSGISNLCILSSLCTAHHLKEKDVLDEYFLPKDADLGQVIILPKAEWERIQGSTREAAHIDEKKEQDEEHLESKAAGEDPRSAALVSTLENKGSCFCIYKYTKDI